MKSIMQGQKIVAVKTGDYRVIVETEREQLTIEPFRDSPWDTLSIKRKKGKDRKEHDD